jgi:SAM-dependent methyltransferase
MAKFGGSRTADDPIYMTEVRRQEPKAMFVYAADLLASCNRPPHQRLLDIGCAMGDFMYYLKSRFPDWEYHGLDVSPRMVEAAAAADPGLRYHCGSVENRSSVEAGAYDVITIFGVLNCLDCPNQALENLFSWIRPGGVILLMDSINSEPIDVIMRHRRAEAADADWEVGWNIWSMETLRRLIHKDGRVKRCEFKEFVLPFDLPKGSDVMRTWTMRTEVKERQLVNGARQLVDSYFVLVSLG